MRKASLVLALAATMVLGSSPAMAHDGLGTYDEAGGHLTHINPLTWLMPPATTVPIGDGVEHVANVPGNTGGHIVAQGNRLYMGNYGTGFTIYDNSDPAAPVKIGQWAPGPSGPNDPGARADAVPDVWGVDGRHIVAFGGTNRVSSTIRTEFVDATDPENLELLWVFTGGADGESHNSDVIDSRGLWIPSGGSGTGGLRIYDLQPLLGSAPAAPINLGRWNPVALWEASPYRNGRPVGNNFTHTHDVEAYPDYEVLLPESEWTDQNGDGSPDPTYDRRDILLMAEGGNYLSDSGDTGSIFVVDITDPLNPVVLNRWNNTTNGTGYEPIRYYHEVQFVNGLDNVIVVTDEDLHNGCEAGGMIVLKAHEDLTKPLQGQSQWFNGLGTPAPVCSMHVMSSRHGFLFNGSYNAGLQVIDLNDPTDPQNAGEFIWPGANSWGALAKGDYVYTGDFGARGLDVYRFDYPDRPNPDPADCKGNKGNGEGKGKCNDKGKGNGNGNNGNGNNGNGNNGNGNKPRGQQR